jgi:hypothetical protein
MDHKFSRATRVTIHSNPPSDVCAYEAVRNVWSRSQRQEAAACGSSLFHLRHAHTNITVSNTATAVPTSVLSQGIAIERNRLIRTGAAAPAVSFLPAIEIGNEG